MSKTVIDDSIFNDLFVLEMANNHWGSLERGYKIISAFSQVVRFNNVRATIKLQFRDVDNFIHKDFRKRSDIRYIDKTLRTKLGKEEYRKLVEAIREGGCLTSATPFDEASVDLCQELNLDFIKIASSDINDWFLIERIAKLRKPVIFSTGGSSLKDIDDLVIFFNNRGIPFALNHCVSIYPSEDSDLNINQIDFLRKRYPGTVIGFSTHEYHDWEASIMLAYAKGARTFERHVDIEDGDIPVSPYCSLPHQVDRWFKALLKAKEMCGGAGVERRFIPEKESKYLETLVRGVYARRDLPAGYVLHHDRMEQDFYLAIPLQKGQFSCREIMNGEKLRCPIRKDEALKVDMVELPHAVGEDLRKRMSCRGL